MKTIKLGSRGLIFEFNDPYLTNVYAIMGRMRAYICDTFCGPDSMRDVIERLHREGYDESQIIVFNSHHHYDHIWGNCAFQSMKIFSHHKCREIMSESAKADLVKYSDHQRGEVRIVLPSMTFSAEIAFHDDEVIFFHSAGHTADSASCIDMQDRVLFVADNVESPVPYLYNADFETYLETLRRYTEIDWEYMVSSHDRLMHDESLLKQNLKYIDELRRWEISVDHLSGRSLLTHVMNLIEIADRLDIDSNATIKHHYKRVLDIAVANDDGLVPEYLLAKLKQLLS